MSRLHRILAVLFVLAIVSGVGGRAERKRAGLVREEAFRSLNQGVSAYKRGDYALAIEKLEASAAAALNSFRANYYLGLAYNADRRYSDAVEALGVALDLQPDHLQANVALGDAFVKMGDLSEANAAYFRSLKLRPEYPPALDGLARIYEAKGDDFQAIQHYRRAMKSDRGYAPAYTHLGDLYLRSNRFEEAVALLEEAIEVRPDFAPGLNRLALAYGRLGLQNEAVATIQRAIELQPADPAHPTTLGRLQLEEGFVTSAEKWFVTALELDPNTAEARAGLAEVARRRGAYPLALGQIDLALADPRLDAALRGRLEKLRAGLEAESIDFAELQERLSAGEAIDRDFARLATIHSRRGEWETAVDYQRRAGDGIAQRERLAYMLLQARRYREAQALYAQLAAETGTVAMEINSGVALALLGDDEAAITAYRRALELDPDEQRARLYLANALLRGGRTEPAVAQYRDFLDSGGRGEAAERVRRILERIAPEAVPTRTATPLTTPAEPVDPDAGVEDGKAKDAGAVEGGTG